MNTLLSVSKRLNREGGDMDIELLTTIRDIDEREWLSLVENHSIEASYNWFKTMEDSGMVNMHYVLVRDRKLLAAACCHRYTGLFGIPLLDVSSPLGLSSAFFSRTPQETEMLLRKLEEIQKREKALGISIFELKKKEFDILKNQLKGFIGFPMLGNTYIDLNFTDFDEYMGFLPYKARRSVRDTIKKAKKMGVRTVLTTEFSQWKDVAYRLQKSVCDMHKDYTFLLDKKFYCALEKNMKDSAELLLFFKDDTPLVFSLVLLTPETAHYKFVGFDPEYKEYQAYFFSFYEIIRRAIEKRQKRIYFGITTYEFKEKIGCQKEELWGLARMRNLLFNAGLRAYLKIFKEFR